MVNRFSVYQLSDAGQKKPCVVISPDELNTVLPHVMVAPIVLSSVQVPFRVLIDIFGKEGQIALDKIRTVSKEKLGQKIGQLPEESYQEILKTLQKMFEL